MFVFVFFWLNVFILLNATWFDILCLMQWRLHFFKCSFLSSFQMLLWSLYVCWFSKGGSKRYTIVSYSCVPLSTVCLYFYFFFRSPDNEGYFCGSARLLFLAGVSLKVIRWDKALTVNSRRKMLFLWWPFPAALIKDLWICFMVDYSWPLK